MPSSSLPHLFSFCFTFPLLCAQTMRMTLLGKKKRKRVDLTLNPIITALAADFFAKRGKTLSGEVDRLLEDFLRSKGIDLSDDTVISRAEELITASKASTGSKDTRNRKRELSLQR